jgi:hypothetical protein
VGKWLWTGAQLLVSMTSCPRGLVEGRRVNASTPHLAVSVLCSCIAHNSYNLTVLTARCIPIIVKQKAMRQRQQWRSRRDWLDKDTLYQLIEESMCLHRQSTELTHLSFLTLFLYLLTASSSVFLTTAWYKSIKNSLSTISGFNPLQPGDL